MHHVLILALTFIQGHTDLNHENNNCLIVSESEDSPTKGLHDNCQSDDLDLQSRSQVRLQLDYFLTCNISDNVIFKLGMAVDLCMALNLTLTLKTSVLRLVPLGGPSSWNKLPLSVSPSNTYTHPDHVRTSKHIFRHTRTSSLQLGFRLSTSKKNRKQR